jgi:hypothetical protein
LPIDLMTPDEEKADDKGNPATPEPAPSAP